MGDIIKVNGSDFVPADAVILSSRYRSHNLLPDLWELLPRSAPQYFAPTSPPKEVKVFVMGLLKKKVQKNTIEISDFRII